MSSFSPDPHERLPCGIKHEYENHVPRDVLRSGAVPRGGLRVYFGSGRCIMSWSVSSFWCLSRGRCPGGRAPLMSTRVNRSVIAGRTGMIILGIRGLLTLWSVAVPFHRDIVTVSRRRPLMFGSVTGDAVRMTMTGGTAMMPGLRGFPSSVLSTRMGPPCTMSTESGSLRRRLLMLMAVGGQWRLGWLGPVVFGRWCRWLLLQQRVRSTWSFLLLAGRRVWWPFW